MSAHQKLFIGELVGLDRDEAEIEVSLNDGVQIYAREGACSHTWVRLSPEQVRTFVGMLQQALQWHLEEIGQTVAMRPTLHLRQITREVPGAVLTVLQQQWTNDDQSAIEWRDVPLVKE